jgi:hypothetical protein
MNRETADLSAELLIVDDVAKAALRPASILRYTAYRDALLVEGVSSQQLVSTLWLFLWNLADDCSVNGVH